MLGDDVRVCFEKSGAINYAPLSYRGSNACVGQVLDRGCQLRVAIL